MSYEHLHSHTTHILFEKTINRLSLIAQKPIMSYAKNYIGDFEKQVDDVTFGYPILSKPDPLQNF